MGSSKGIKRDSGGGGWREVCVIIRLEVASVSQSLLQSSS